MYYIDSQRTVTRRDSSLIAPKRSSQILDPDWEGLSTARATSTAHLTSDSSTSLVARAKGSVQKEIVTMLFESMVDSIVETWEVIIQQKSEESQPNMLMKTASEVTFTSKKKKPAGMIYLLLMLGWKRVILYNIPLSISVKPSKTKKSRSKMGIDNNAQVII